MTNTIASEVGSNVPDMTTTTITETTAIACPDYCTEPKDHVFDDARLLWSDDGRVATPGIYCAHEGPIFGPFHVVGEVNYSAGTKTAYAMFDDHWEIGNLGTASNDAPALRELAANALAAAEWLEAHR